MSFHRRCAWTRTLHTNRLDVKGLPDLQSGTSIYTPGITCHRHGVDDAVGTVSPYCQVGFMPTTDEYQPLSRIYTRVTVSSTRSALNRIPGSIRHATTALHGSLHELGHPVSVVSATAAPWCRALWSLVVLGTTGFGRTFVFAAGPRVRRLV
jgi:hypothetical protein